MTWKLQIPLLRCPHCRNWVQVINRGEWKAQVPPKKLLERLRHEQDSKYAVSIGVKAFEEGKPDSPASQSSYKSARTCDTRAREEAENDG